MQFMRLHDMVTENGKTVRENYLEIPHTIKLGSLVEPETAMQSTSFHFIPLHSTSFMWCLMEKKPQYCL